MNSNIEEFIGRATSGFNGDSGLRAEIEDELRSHVESRIAELGGGESAFQQASEEFGDPSEMATALVAANASRLEARSRLSFFTRRVLVPVSILAGIFIGFQELRRFASFNAFSFEANRDEMGALSRWIVNSPAERISRGLTEHEKNVVFSQASGELSTAESLWESAPTNPIYYVALVTASLNSEKPLPANMVAVGDRIDPGNAFYRLLLGLLDFEKGEVESGYEWVKEAADMPRYERYRPKLIQEGHEIIGPPKSLSNRMDQLWVMGSMPFLEATKVRAFSEFAATHAVVLSEQDDREGLKELIATKMAITRHLVGDITNLVEGLVACSQMTNSWSEFVEPCRLLDLDAEASEIESLIESSKSLLDEILKVGEPVEGELEQFMKHAGLIAGISAPAIKGNSRFPSGEELIPLRAVDYLVIDRAAVSIFVVMLLMVMLACAIVAEFKKRRRGTPSIFLLGLGDYGVILGIGLVLPVFGYFLITRASPFGGHDVALHWGGLVWAQHLVAFSVLILQLIAVATRWRLVGNRWKLYRSEKLVFISVGILFIIASLASIWPIMPEVLWCVAAFTILVACGSAALWWRRMFASKDTYLERATVPVAGAVIVCLAVFVIPLLNARERYWVPRDTLLLPDSATGFNKIETRATEEIRRGLTNVLNGK